MGTKGKGCNDHRPFLAIVRSWAFPPSKMGSHWKLLKSDVV